MQDSSEQSENVVVKRRARPLQQLLLDCASQWRQLRVVIFYARSVHSQGLCVSVRQCASVCVCVGGGCVFVHKRVRGSFYAMSKFHLQHILCICISHLSHGFSLLFFSFYLLHSKNKNKHNKKNCCKSFSTKTVNCCLIFVHSKKKN